MDNVLITGGTSGIGYELARVFAGKGHDLILVSSDYGNLKTAQLSLQTEFAVSIMVS